jgi:GxxExxY protein
MKYLKRNRIEEDDHDPLSGKVISIAIRIHKDIGPGFPESISHRAMEIELAEAGVFFVSQAPLVFKYKGHVLGTFAADMIVEKRLLPEFKALDHLPLLAELQVVSYLRASQLDTGLILNFGAATLEIKRKYRIHPARDHDLLLHES